jgi:hypothetical protein
VVTIHLVTVFVAALGLAVGASLLIHALGASLGLLAATMLAAAVLAPGGPAWRLHRLLGLEPAAVTRSGRAATGPRAPRRPLPLTLDP